MKTEDKTRNFLLLVLSYRGSLPALRLSYASAYLI